ncbi:MAG: zinc metallopeptidase [Clostridia bacterium]|nr:zinc metallopeptidase [Clostridia bacterium]
MFVYIDLIFYILIFIAFLFGISAQVKVNTTFNRYKDFYPQNNQPSETAIKNLLETAGLNNIKLASIKGELTDNYNPKTKTISLSESTQKNASVASLGVVAHEIGHAMQDKDGYAPLKIRNAIVPWAKFGSIAFYPLFIIGLIMLFVSSTTLLGRILIYSSTTLYFLSTLFYIVTLPVERDASKRAIELLKNSGSLNNEELHYAQEVLKAAELTYVSALITSLLYFLRFLFYVTRILKRD